ncbi:MAG: amidohydrolase family protein [Lentisphaerae bacterium]|nr:amidohydrolase family protein [Lentisphaerota bacterium]
MIIDFHTHAFPDGLAERAMRTLLAETEAVTAYLDGTVGALLDSMDRAGIARSVVCSIATRPEQFENIFEWSRQIASDRIVPFPSVHPADPERGERLRRVREAGFRGIKLHPYYQDFVLNEDRLLPLYEQAAELGLIVVMHTGYDVAFPRDQRRADPAKTMDVVRRVPSLKLVTTHLGAWEDWDDVIALMLGQPVYMGLSYALDCMPREQARRMLLRHPATHLLFGSDSPWKDQAETLRLVRAMELGPEREAALLSGNASRLLDPSA